MSESNIKIISKTAVIAASIISIICIFTKWMIQGVSMFGEFLNSKYDMFHALDRIVSSDGVGIALFILGLAVVSVILNAVAIIFAAVNKPSKAESIVMLTVSVLMSLLFMGVVSGANYEVQSRLGISADVFKCTISPYLIIVCQAVSCAGTIQLRKHLGVKPAGSAMDAKCPGCGAKIARGALFCDNCGKKLSDAQGSAELKYCTECGAVIDDGAAFCVSCGNKVE